MLALELLMYDLHVVRHLRICGSCELALVAPGHLPRLQLHLLNVGGVEVGLEHTLGRLERAQATQDRDDVCSLTLQMPQLWRAQDVAVDAPGVPAVLAAEDAADVCATGSRYLLVSMGSRYLNGMGVGPNWKGRRYRYGMAVGTEIASGNQERGRRYRTQYIWYRQIWTCMALFMFVLGKSSLADSFVVTLVTGITHSFIHA